jgi:hypothetical protein
VSSEIAFTKMLVRDLKLTTGCTYVGNATIETEDSDTAVHSHRLYTSSSNSLTSSASASDLCHPKDDVDRDLEELVGCPVVQSSRCSS